MMASLNLSAFIPATPEDVYRHVTAFDKDGPLEGEFKTKYGSVLSRDGNVFVTQEEVGNGKDGDAEKITWRCTFDYPSRRLMEAVDSTWANRVDVVRPARGGTRWSIRWDTHVGGVIGLVQHLVFRLVGHRRIRRAMVDPVKEHFKGVF
jgi:hypothetical protein